MYVYLIFKSSKDVILKIKSITKSCIYYRYSQESFMEIPNLYMDRRLHHVKDIHIMSYAGILKEVDGGNNQYVEYLEK